MTRPEHSLPPAYFEAKYAEKLDYWDFATSPYEAAKYAHTLAALTRPGYESAFEIGCSIGVLTAKLSERCEHLLAVDVSARALEAARARCPEVRIEQMRFPHEQPRGEQFDLIVISEVAYYWSRAELGQAQEALMRMLTPGGELLLVHWTPEATDYPLTGHEVHESFLAVPGLHSLVSDTREKYRLDLLQRR